MIHEYPGIVEVNVGRRSGTQLFLHGNKNFRNLVKII